MVAAIQSESRKSPDVDGINRNVGLVQQLHGVLKALRHIRIRQLAVVDLEREAGSDPDQRFAPADAGNILSDALKRLQRQGGGVCFLCTRESSVSFAGESKQSFFVSDT